MNSDWVIFWIVAGARFLLPLTIPRYPLPGILASLVLDGIDQTLFQQFTNLPLDHYQGYDKALDIYYLTVAYITMLRNWQHLFAFKVGRFLFYWRLVGVALFELTGLRPLLLIFPNTFEYFFIFYETCRLRWNPARLSNKLIVGAAAFIWIVIKLPQEYWIHIAQIDTTDWLKTGLFDVPVDTAWSEIVRAWPGMFVAALIVVVLALLAAWWYVVRCLPAPDRPFSFSADAYQPPFTADRVRSAMEQEARRIVDAALIEKIVLLALVSLCFAHVLPDVRANTPQLVLGLAFIVTVNTALTHWLARKGFGWTVDLGRFVALLTINVGMIWVYGLLRARLDVAVRFENVLFFALLLTLLLMLYDRYRQIYLIRFKLDDRVSDA